jgi:uncharacterized membrane protein
VLKRVASASADKLPVAGDAGVLPNAPAAGAPIRPGRLAILVQVLVGSALVAGIVHIVSILTMPLFAPDDAYTRIASLAPVGTIHLLPKSVPGQEVLPYTDPASAMAVCRFDLTMAPLRIRTKTVSDGFLSVSFHDRRGSVFYAVTDKAATRGAIEVVVFTPAQLEAAEAADTEDEQPRELRVTAPSLTGFVMFRALALRPSAYSEVEDQLKAIACEVERTAASSSGATLATP